MFITINILSLTQFLPPRTRRPKFAEAEARYIPHLPQKFRYEDVASVESKTLDRALARDELAEDRGASRRREEIRPPADEGALRVASRFVL